MACRNEEMCHYFKEQEQFKCICPPGANCNPSNEDLVEYEIRLYITLYNLI